MDCAPKDGTVVIGSGNWRGPGSADMLACAVRCEGGLWRYQNDGGKWTSQCQVLRWMPMP